MSFYPACTSPNPYGQQLPAAPNPAQAIAGNPAQGDHVFGDVLGAIRTAMQAIFVSDANWRTRMAAYNANMATIWNGLEQLDLGHGAHPPSVARQPAGVAGNETDQHAYVFGGYANRLQWQMAEIACMAGATPTIGADANNLSGWKSAVLARFDELMANVADQTALNHLVLHGNVTRTANGSNHPAISLQAAQTFANANRNAPGYNLVAPVLNNLATLRNGFVGLLDRFQPGFYTLQPNGSWASHGTR